MMGRTLIWVLAGAGLFNQPDALAESWQVVKQTRSEIVSVDTDSLRHEGRYIWFREKRVALIRQLDPGSLRPIRELQARRIADCDQHTLATVSLSVFSDHDALIDYQALRPQQARWEPALLDREVFERACG